MVFKVIGIIVLLLALGIGVFWKKLPFRLVLPYIVQDEIMLKGRVEKVTFTGSEAGEQTYFVYLPEGYDAGDQRYNTLYHLHGAFIRETWLAYECEFIGSQVERAVSEGLIDPIIVVCPFDPEGDSMWSDSFDGQYMASSGFRKDLIPHIDAAYRTNPERESRVLQGFSMGGFGVVTNAFRSPELFNAIIIWDGALHNWESISSKRASIARKMFATEDYFNQWSPMTLSKNAAEADLDIFMVVGEMKDTRIFGYPFRDQLETTDARFTYHDVACPHSIFCMVDDLFEESFSFLAAAYRGK